MRIVFAFGHELSTLESRPLHSRGNVMKSWMIALLLSFPLFAGAESVLQVKGKKFLFEAGGFKNGDVLTITGTDGSSKGSAIVKQAGKNKSLAEVTSGFVAVGDTVSSESSSSGGSSFSSSSGRNRKFVFGAGLSMGLSNTLKMTGTYNAGFGNQTLDSSGKSGTGFGLIGDAQYWFTDMLGATATFEYEMDRKADAGLTHKINGSTVTISSDDKIQLIYLTANGAFRFKQFYFPIGINYPLVLKYSSSSPVTIGVQMGYQFGAGWKITEHIGVEFLYRITNFQVQVKTTTDTRTWDTAQLTGMLLQGKYWF